MTTPLIDAPDPRDNRTGIKPTDAEAQLTPEAKALVTAIEAKNAELQTAFGEKLAAAAKDSADAIAAAKQEAQARLTALADEVINLEVELQRMRSPQIAAKLGTGVHGEEGAVAALGWNLDPKDRAVAHIRVHPKDPRETPEWAGAFSAWLRNEKEALAERDRTIIYAGNSFQRGLDPKNTLSSDFGQGGGVWVAPTIERAVTRRLVEYSQIRAEARVVTTGGPYYEGVIRTTRRDTIEGAGEREIFADPATEERRYEVVKIPVRDMRVRPALTQNLIEDSTADLAAELREDLSLDFAKEEVRWFMVGDGGPKEALGLATTTAYPEVNSGIADDLDHGSVTRLMLDLRPFYRNTAQASYCLSRDALLKLMLEEDAVHRRIWQPSTQDGIPSRLNGYRWWEGIELDDVAAGAHPVFFGNFYLGYRIVDRAGLRVLRDETSKVPLVIFNMWRRVGGGPWLDEALRRLKIAA